MGGHELFEPQQAGNGSSHLPLALSRGVHDVAGREQGAPVLGLLGGLLTIHQWEALLPSVATEVADVRVGRPGAQGLGHQDQDQGDLLLPADLQRPVQGCSALLQRDPESGALPGRNPGVAGGRQHQAPQDLRQRRTHPGPAQTSLPRRAPDPVRVGLVRVRAVVVATGEEDQVRLQGPPFPFQPGHGLEGAVAGDAVVDEAQVARRVGLKPGLRTLRPGLVGLDADSVGGRIAQTQHSELTVPAGGRRFTPPPAAFEPGQVPTQQGVGGVGRARQPLQEVAGGELLDGQEDKSRDQGLGHGPARASRRPAPGQDQQEEAQGREGQVAHRGTGRKEPRVLPQGNRGGQEEGQGPLGQSDQRAGGQQHDQQAPPPTLRPAGPSEPGEKLRPPQVCHARNLPGSAGSPCLLPDRDWRTTRRIVEARQMRPGLFLLLLTLVLLAPSCARGPGAAPTSSVSPSPVATPVSGPDSPASVQEADSDELGTFLLDLGQGRLAKPVTDGARRASPFVSTLLERLRLALAGRDPGPSTSEEEALAYEYLFGSPQATARSLQAFGCTLCASRVDRLWTGTRRNPPPSVLPTWARCPVDGRPYSREPDALSCVFHQQRFSVQQPSPANRPSELYPQLAMGYFGAERGHGLDDVFDPAVPSGVRPGETVVDFGCGVGCYTWAMARRAGPRGRVLAVDLDRGVLDFVAFVAARRGMGQVRTVQATRSSPNLPGDSVDRIVLVDVYNVIAGIDLGVSGRPGPRTVHVMQKLVNSLRGGGHLVLVDFVPQPGLLHVSEEQAVRDMKDLGLEPVDRRLSRDGSMYVLTFRKP